MLRKELFSRRSFIYKTMGLSIGLVLHFFTGRVSKLFSAYASSQSDSKIAAISASDLSKDTIEKMVKAAFNEFGGVGHFIKKGMKVVIKPNIAWNSPPERAHNTNPYMVEAVARLCRERGAKVTIFDRTCNNARLSYKASGMRDAAKRAGAKLEYIDSRKYVKVNVPGALRQKTLMVYKPLLDADFVINMPIIKHHSLANITLSMKNLMGVLGGNRGVYHQDIHKNIVDFTKAIKVDLVICDALRILTRHGPNGGSPSDIKEPKTIIMGINPVTVDAYAAKLFGISPSKIGYISLAFDEGMGEIYTKRMNIRKKSV